MIENASTEQNHHNNRYAATLKKKTGSEPLNPKVAKRLHTLTGVHLTGLPKLCPHVVALLQPKSTSSTIVIAWVFGHVRKVLPENSLKYLVVAC